MHLGLVLPVSGPLASTENIARMAIEAERIGYSTLWTYERLLRPVAELPEVGDPPARLPEYYRLTFEPLETLSYLAALTSRIKLGTCAIVAVLHVPVVLARRFATLDQLSGGRVVVGLAQGWISQEFETANIPMSRRGAGFDEFSVAMRACWGPDPVSHEGRYYRIAPSEVNPKPVQARLPILYAPGSQAGLERAARAADGVLLLVDDETDLRWQLQILRDTARVAGRDPSELRVVVMASVPMTDDRLGPGRPFLGGSPDEIAGDLGIAADLGVYEVGFRNDEPGELSRELDLVARLYAAAAH